MPQPAAGPTAVEVVDLVKRYGATTAVDGVSLTVPTGSVTAILGPNGAGNTTTVEAAEGYRRPDSGRVRVLGLDPVADARTLRPKVGVMLQEGGIYPTSRTMEALRYHASLYAHPLDPRVLVELLGLGSVLGTPYRRLSGGQQQRLSLALALVGRPELVFLDEPTAGMDPQARLATWAVVEQLRDDGVTVVLTTHLMDEAERLADQVVVVDRGRVVAAGTPAELTSAGAENTVTFHARAHLELAELRRALDPVTVIEEVSPGSYRLRGTVDPQLLATVTAWCAAHDVMPQGLTVDRRSLEDVFLELTGRQIR